jgi:hypothetical protein
MTVVVGQLLDENGFAMQISQHVTPSNVRSRSFDVETRKNFRASPARNVHARQGERIPVNIGHSPDARIGETVHLEMLGRFLWAVAELDYDLGSGPWKFSAETTSTYPRGSSIGEDIEVTGIGVVARTAQLNLDPITLVPGKPRRRRRPRRPPGRRRRVADPERRRGAPRQTRTPADPGARSGRSRRGRGAVLRPCARGSLPLVPTRGSAGEPWRAQVRPRRAEQHPQRPLKTEPPGSCAVAPTRHQMATAPSCHPRARRWHLPDPSAGLHPGRNYLRPHPPGQHSPRAVLGGTEPARRLSEMHLRQRLPHRAREHPSDDRAAPRPRRAARPAHLAATREARPVRERRAAHEARYAGDPLGNRCLTRRCLDPRSCRGLSRVEDRLPRGPA